MGQVEAHRVPALLRAEPRHAGLPRITEAILPLRYTDNAVFLILVGVNPNISGEPLGAPRGP